MWITYKNVLTRLEQIQYVIENIIKYFPEIKTMTINDNKIEYYLYQEALKGEENGNVEDMLGNVHL